MDGMSMDGDGTDFHHIIFRLLPKKKGKKNQNFIIICIYRLFWLNKLLK